MRTTKTQSKFLIQFFVSFFVLFLTVSCSDKVLEENEELLLLISDKDEEPDTDDRKSKLLLSEKEEEPDPDDRD